MEEFLDSYADQKAELIKGIVCELPTPNKGHGYLCSLISFFLREFVMRGDLGRVFANDTSLVVRRNPDTLYGPDVCFVSFALLPKGELTPERVVEVRSPSDTWAAIFGKITDYFTAGVQAIIVLDEASRTASVYRPNAVQVTLSIADTLTIPDVLPGFAVPVQRLFA